MTLASLRLPLANAAIYLITCALAGTGLLLELRMDAEDGAVRILGMNRDDWGELHIIIAIAFLATTVLHLCLNWAWIKAVVAKTEWAIPLLAIGLVLIAALLVWPADRETMGPGTRPGRHLIDEN